MKYRPDSFYQDNNVKTMLGKTAVSIDSANKCVRLDSGECICYDSLLAATGSSPFVPVIKGLDTVEKKFTFMKLDDAYALEKELKPDSRVLVIGAGLIGLKCVEGIAGRVGEITVADMADRILPSVLDHEGAQLVQSFIEERELNSVLATVRLSSVKTRRFLKAEKRSILIFWCWLWEYVRTFHFSGKQAQR